MPHKISRKCRAANWLCAAMFLAVPPAAAEDKNLCTLSNNYCVPVVGCLAENDRLFVGRSFGRREGPVVVKTLDGVSCRGSWKRTLFGGKARFACDDGTSGKIRYNYLDKKTGTATGKGKTDGGETMEFWAGHNLLKYFVFNEKLRNGALACGQAALPMS